MARLTSTVVRPPRPDDYCVGLSKTANCLVACFNSSNSLSLHSMQDLAQSREYLTGSPSVLSEIAVLDENSVFWSDRVGNVALIDLRTSASVMSWNLSSDIFSIDAAGETLAVASDKDLKVFDLRTCNEKRRYDQLYADDSDVTSVKIHKEFNNFILSGSEDSNFALCDVNNVDDDDFTLVGFDEPVLKVGFTGNEVFAVGMNRLVAYDLNFLQDDAPIETKRKFELGLMKEVNPDLDFFVAEFGEREKSFVAGSHE